MRVRRSTVVPVNDVGPVVASELEFDDPWAAARLLLERAQEDATDPAVRAWAAAMLAQIRAQTGMSGAVQRSEWGPLARSIHRNVSEQIAFVDDSDVLRQLAADYLPESDSAEVFQAPRVTMATGAGDCDCHSALVYSLASAAGVPAKLVFFEQDGQPTHVVAKLHDGDDWRFAETTLEKWGGAHFGEAPLDAVERLKAQGRGDIGELGTAFASQNEVDTAAQELFPYADALNQAAQLCPSLTDAQRTAWAGVYAALQTLKADVQTSESDWLYKISAPQAWESAVLKWRWGTLLDRLNAQRPVLASWATTINQSCVSTPGGGTIPAPAIIPPPPGGSTATPTDWGSVAKWGIGAAIFFGVAYLVGPAIRGISTSAGRRYASG